MTNIVSSTSGSVNVVRGSADKERANRVARKVCHVGERQRDNIEFILGSHHLGGCMRVVSLGGCMLVACVPKDLPTMHDKVSKL